MYDDAHRSQAVWIGECPLEVTFTGQATKADYGVPGSPVFNEITNIEIEELKLFGVLVDPRALPSELLEAIHEISDEIDW